MEKLYDGDVERVRNWATDLETETAQQALASARSPAVSGPIALMPDAHLGMGATVGSVIPTESAIIPAAVGVDIGCGMVAVETSLDASDLPDTLEPLLAGVGKAIPAGFNWHDESSKAAEAWLADNPPPSLDRFSNKARKKVATQLGTLGGGNHFVEVALDEADTVWAVLHSGSRGIGNQLAQGHIREAKRLCKDLHRKVEDPNLAYFVEGEAEFQAYLADMLWAQDYAWRNRELMMDALLGTMRKLIQAPFTEKRRVNCHHNYTEQECHGGCDQWITRKGAIRAQVGDWGVIPGSMGTDTYIVSGLGNPDSYNSASHGAGRRMSRTKAKKNITKKALAKAMEGRTWQADLADKLIDEAPKAYKDIAEVMKNQADLVKVEHRLHAVLNYKGT